MSKDDMSLRLSMISARKCALAAIDLQYVILRKCKRLKVTWPPVIGDGSLVTIQVVSRGGQLECGVGVMLFLYEAGLHGTIYPRLAWRLPYFMEVHEAIMWAMKQERKRENTRRFVALRDNRMPAEVEFQWRLAPILASDA